MLVEFVVILFEFLRDEIVEELVSTHHIFEYISLKDSRRRYEIERSSNRRVLKVLGDQVHETTERRLVVHASSERHREHILARYLTERVFYLIVCVLEIVIDALAVVVQSLADRLQTVDLQRRATSTELVDRVDEELLVLVEVLIVR